MKRLYARWFNDGDIKGTKALKILMKRQKVAARGKAIFGQVKILIGYFQCLIAFMQSGEATFPTDYSQLMDSFEFVNVDILSIMKGMCLMPDINFYQIFFFNACFPLAIAFLVLFRMKTTQPSEDDIAEDESLKNHGTLHKNFCCMLAFMVYPNVSRCVLSMFYCHTVQWSETETKVFLHADYSLQCYEADYFFYMFIAICGVFVYPLGIPFFFITLLRSYSKISVNGLPMEEDPESQMMLNDPVIEESYGFLYARFRVEYWWYETSEMMRKLFIGSLAMFITPGSPTQVVTVLVANTYFMCQQMLCWPFKTYDDNAVMAISLVATSLTLFGALIINADVDLVDNWGPGIAKGMLIGTTIILIILYIVLLLRFHLPFVCEWMMPDCIRESCLNCFAPGNCFGPKLAVVTDKLEEESEEESEWEEESEEEEEDEEGEGSQIPDEVVEKDEIPEDPEIDNLINKYFERYDLDGSGTLNSDEEREQLTTNLCFKFRVSMEGSDIDKILQSETEKNGELSDDYSWDAEEFTAWFKTHFIKPCGITVAP